MAMIVVGPTRAKRNGSGMGKESKVQAWRMYREISERGSYFLGVLEAEDEEQAIKKAIEEFDVAKEHRKRVVAARRDE
jgi:hypothetical protein